MTGKRKGTRTTGKNKGNMIGRKESSKDRKENEK